MNTDRIRMVIATLASSRRLLSFLSIGVIGAFVDNSVLFAIVEGTGTAPTVAAIAAKECSILIMFVLNERITFAAVERSDGIALVRRAISSNAVRIGGTTVGIAVLYILHNHFEVWYLAANIVGIGVGFIVNYVFESLVTWQVHR